MYSDAGLQVSWAMGSGTSAPSGPDKEASAATEDRFRRLFAAVDFDPGKQAPPTSYAPEGGEGEEGPAGWGGWLAGVLDVRLLKVKNQ